MRLQRQAQADEAMQRAAVGVIEQLASLGVHPVRMTVDSRAVAKGDLFAAYPGRTTDGRRFIQSAIRSGASAVLWEPGSASWSELAGPGSTTPNIGVADLRQLSGPIASLVFGQPSQGLRVVGVTGTNGKTSTTQWIAQALGAAGERCGVIGTLGAGFPESLRPTANTTPEAAALQEWLAALRTQGASAVAMEVSSIALDQGRINGIAFRCAVLTNVTRDHLDYHDSMERYREAKARLFAAPGLSHTVINLDDPLGQALARDATVAAQRIGYTRLGGHAESPRVHQGVDELLCADAIEQTDTGLRFELCGPQGRFPVASSLTGRFNVSNLLAVAGVLRTGGMPLEQVAGLLCVLRPVPGRLERFGGGDRPLVLVDYAHTPDALENVLAAAREVAGKHGKLIVVFGCGGDRDRGKRPEMGHIAVARADRVVVTSDNPRSEPPEAIIQDILSGVPRAVRARVVHDVDRAQAIAAAIATARSRDVVLIAGKGHEPYQEVAGVKLPFSDAEEALRALSAWRGLET